jgi:hypothetical protein
MSDIMLLGVLRMPFEMAMSDDLSRLQFHERARKAADRIEADAELIAQLQAENAALRAERDAIRRDAERLDFIEYNPDAVVRSRGYLGAPDSWSWRDENKSGHDAPSLRDAIDAAMEQPG